MIRTDADGVRTVTESCLANMAALPTDSLVDADDDDLVRLLDALTRAAASTRELIGQIETILVDRIDDADPLVVAGVGRVTRTTKWSDRWADADASDRFQEDLASSVVRQVALDVASGELDPVKANVARAAVHELLDAIPRVSKLNAVGQKRLRMRNDEYRTSSMSYRVTIEEEL